MAKKDLVTQLLEDPNSAFKEEDKAYLSKLPQETLKRLALATQSQPEQVVVANADARKSELLTGLSNCQQDILELIQTEDAIIGELNELGIQKSSVLDKIVPVTNASTEPSLTEANIINYVKTATTGTAKILREGITAREQYRSKAITNILNNTTIYNEKELKNMYTEDLVKMSQFIQQNRPVHNEQMGFDYSGAGLADRSISPTTGSQFGASLDIPSTFSN